MEKRKKRGTCKRRRKKDEDNREMETKRVK
jgi:hypothetical protein